MNQIRVKMIIEKPSDLFCTPPDLIEDLECSFGPFFMDACCNRDNCIVPLQKKYMNERKSFGLESDYLATNPEQWREYMYKKTQFYTCKHNTIFMNPPYSEPELFMKKAWSDSKNHRIVILVKTDMSTNWFNHALEHEDNEHNPMPFHHINPDWTRKQFLQISAEKYNACKKSLGDLCPKIAIIHLRKRVKFYYNGIKAKSSGTFPSCLVIYDRRQKP